MMKRIKESFAGRLSLNILGLTSFLFVLSIWVTAMFSHQLILMEATKRASDVEAAAASEIRNVLQRVETAAENAVWLVSEKREDETFLYHITAQMVRQNEDIIGSAVAFASDYCGDRPYFSPYSWLDSETGELRSKQLGNENYDYFSMEWFQAPSTSRCAVWSEPYFDEGGGETQMSTYSVPLIGDDGEVICVVTADISMKWLSELLDSIHPYEGSYAFLLSSQGSFVGLVSDPLKGCQTLNDAAVRLNAPRLTELSDEMASGESGIFNFLCDRRQSFIAYSPIGNGWTLALVCGAKEVTAGTSTMDIVLLVVGLLGLLVLFFLCRSTIKKLTQPLSDFANSALNIADGDFHTELPEVTTDDEIRRLHDSFEHMQHSLTTYMENLKSTTAANERMESELNIASSIQSGMLSHRFPVSEQVDLCADMKPAREVGGDLYDFYLRNNVVYFAIGDVSGKGVPASLLMTITRAAFHFLTGIGLGMKGIIERINNAIVESNDTGMFVTLFSGRLNLKTGEMRFCNAGHNPLLVIPPRIDEPLTFLPVKPNLAVGVMEDFDYEDQYVTLEPGTRLVLYTDGITEAENFALEQYGEARLMAWAEGIRTQNLSSQQCVESLLASVNAFTGDAEQNDDRTILIVHYL